MKYKYHHGEHWCPIGKHLLTTLYISFQYAYNKYHSSQIILVHFNKIIGLVQVICICDPEKIIDYALAYRELKQALQDGGYMFILTSFSNKVGSSILYAVEHCLLNSRLVSCYVHSCSTKELQVSVLYFNVTLIRFLCLFVFVTAYSLALPCSNTSFILSLN